MDPFTSFDLGSNLLDGKEVQEEKVDLTESKELEVLAELEDKVEGALDEDVELDYPEIGDDEKEETGDLQRIYDFADEEVELNEVT